MLKKAIILVGVLAFVVLAYGLLRGGSSTAPDESPLDDASPPTAASDSPPPREAPELDGFSQTPNGFSGEIDSDSVEPPPIVLPPLAESDPFLREELEAFSLRPDWLAQNDLMRRLAVLVDNMTRGDLPRRQIRFLRPEGRFEVIERDGAFFAEPANQRRFDPFLDLLESIEPAAAARFLERTGPLFETAFRELGTPVSGREALRDAIERVLETSVSPADPELVRPNVLWEYADRNLETLPALEKQMLRLGSRNRSRLRAYLVELRNELDSSGR